MQGIQKVSFLVYAALLSIIGLFASDMYLPTLNQIREGFGTTEALVGISLSIYMIGFAFAQLVYGPLSDQIGRKPALALGLALFAVGTFGCIYSPSIEVFLAFRLVQAIGVCAAYILWQPMIIDLFEGEEVQKIFSMLMALGALSPAAAPIAGGYIASSWGWEAVFWLIQGITALLLFWTLFVFKESLPKEARSESFALSRVLSAYKSLFTDKGFIGFSFTIALGVTLYLVYLTIIPFILHGQGYSTDEIGLTYLPFSIAFLIGAQIGKTMHPKYGDMPLIRFGVLTAVVGSVVLFMVPVVFPQDNAWWLIAGFSIITFSNGFTIPIGMAFLIQRHSKTAGTCASSIGFLVAFFGFVSTGIASLLVEPIGVYSITTVILGFNAVMLMMYIIGRKGLQQEAGAGSALSEPAS
jgi:DHA1 family bicyclomycin/chloramphenicol resistance-like MFS transporter